MTRGAPGRNLLKILSAPLAVALAAALLMPRPAPAQSGVVVPIAPGQSIQAVVDANPAGTTYLLRHGIHRYVGPIGNGTIHIRPKEGDTFLGEDGAILRGSVDVDPAAFTPSGTWYAAPWSQEISTGVDLGEGSYTGVKYREDLFADDQPVWQVESLADLDLGANEWYHDRTNDRIYLSFNPAGKDLELSLVSFAIRSDVKFVTIRHLTIEKYANDAQTGAVEGQSNADYWLIEDCLIRHNHGTGLKLGWFGKARNCRLLWNGQLGVGGRGANLLIEYCEVAWNNYAGFSYGWEGGGSKFFLTENAVVRGCHFHHNIGAGIWFDSNNRDALIEYNIVHDNVDSGIFYEISYGSTIRYNTVYYNGQKRGTLWADPAGIMISASDSCYVYSNRVWGNQRNIIMLQQRRGSGRWGPFEARGARIFDNVIGWESYYGFYLKETIGTSNQLVGVFDDTGLDMITSAEWDNRFYRNRYQDPGNPGARLWRWQWLGRNQSFSEWQNSRQDTDGTMSPDLAGLLNTYDPDRAAPGEVLLGVKLLSAAPGSAMTIAVTLENPTASVHSGHFTLASSPAGAATLRSAAPGSRLSGWEVSIGSGQRISFFTSGSGILPGEGEILRLEFGLAPGIGRNSEISFTFNELEIADNSRNLLRVRLTLNRVTVGCALAGDVNGDGKIDVFDLLTLLSYLNGQVNPNPDQLACADLDPNGRIDIFDLLKILSLIGGRAATLAAAPQAGTVPEWGQVREQLAGLGLEPQVIEQVRQLYQEAVGLSLPRAFTLEQNSPNPFNPSTTLGFSVPEGYEGEVSLQVFDLRGRLVRTLSEGPREPGHHLVFWDGSDQQGHPLASGIYFYRLRAGDFAQTRKMVLMK